MVCHDVVFYGVKRAHLSAHSIEPRTSTTRVAVKIEETLATERCNIPIVTFCTLSKCVGRTHKPTFSHEPSKEGLSISRLLVKVRSMKLIRYTGFMSLWNDFRHELSISFDTKICQMTRRNI